MYQEPKKLAELQPGVRNFCGDFNARNSQILFEVLYYRDAKIESFDDQVVIRWFIFHKKILISSLKYIRNPKS